MAPIALELDSSYGLVILGVVLMVVQYHVLGQIIGAVRRRLGVDYPDTGSGICALCSPAPREGPPLRPPLGVKGTIVHQSDPPPPSPAHEPL